MIRPAAIAAALAARSLAGALLVLAPSAARAAMPMLVCTLPNHPAGESGAFAITLDLAHHVVLVGETRWADGEALPSSPNKTPDSDRLAFVHQAGDQVSWGSQTKTDHRVLTRWTIDLAKMTIALPDGSNAPCIKLSGEDASGRALPR